MDLAKEAVAANAAATEPEASNIATDESAANVPYARATQALLVWHAAKQIQTLVYELTNDLDPMRRLGTEDLTRHKRRAKQVKMWAEAMEQYVSASGIEITPIMAAKKK